MDIPIIFEDQDLVIIAKPAGVVVNDATSVRGETLQQWFREHLAGESGSRGVPSEFWQALVPDDFSEEYGSPEAIFTEREGMVHRLDKETSGVMVFAKNPGSLVHLLAQFRDREVAKSYVCLVHGKVQPDRDVIRAPLGRATGKDRKKFQVRPDGRPAETEYHVLHYWSRLNQAAAANIIPSEVISHPSYQQGFSLVKAIPHTGRTHQIRVHFAHAGHPLVGDATYTGKRRAKADNIWCKRHFLHASTLTITHPRTGQHITFTAPLDAGLQQVLKLAFDADVKIES